MATKIVTKNSSTASAVPTASDLVQGELAVNVADKRLFTEDNGGAIVELGTNPSTLTVTGEITANGGIALGDNDKATFGNGDDLEIYHDGSHSYISDTGQGDLKISGSSIVDIKCGDDIMFRATEGGATQIRYDGLQKLKTTSTGIDVTGEVVAEGLTVEAASDALIRISDSTNANQRLDLQHDGGTASLISGNNGAYGTIKLQAYNGTATVDRFKIAANGDISFYEDTGTTAKFFWDASAEFLGIGTSSPNRPLTVSKAGEQIVGEFINTIASQSARIYATCGTASGQIQQYGSTHATDPNTLRIGTNAGDIILAPSSVERVRVTTAGNVGIGTDSPSESLHTSGNIRLGDSSPAELYTNTNELRLGVDKNNDNADSNITFYTNDDEKMRIDASGKVGIGTSSPSKNLHVYNGTTNRPALIESGDADSLIEFKDNSTTNAPAIGATGNNLVVQTGSSATERMRIDSSGNLLVGTTDTTLYNNTSGSGINLNGSGRIDVTRGDVCLNLNRNTSDGSIIELRKDGTSVGSISVTASATAYNTSSDQRLKENIADADDAGSKIDAIQVRKYDWKADGSHQDYGMIAQELLEVAPEAVSVPEDSEEMMGVDYSKLVPMLIKEIQSLRNRVAQLEE